MPALFLLFSHTLTEDQQKDAKASLGVTQFHHLPEDLQQIWSQVTLYIKNVADHAIPIWDWLVKEAKQGDYVLIQGDFGMTYATVNYALTLGLNPVYSTTIRRSKEETNEAGKVTKTLVFQHVRYRSYSPSTPPQKDP